MRTMKTRELARALGVSVQAVTDATGKVLPSKIVQKGVATRYTENEVALLTQYLTHTTSNNSRVNKEAYTAKSLLLDFLTLMSKYNFQVNLEVAKSHVLEISETEARHAVTSLARVFSTNSPATRFKAAFKLSDIMDVAADKARIREKLEEWEF